jgi:hypothetical protein
MPGSLAKQRGRRPEMIVYKHFTAEQENKPAGDILN